MFERSFNALIMKKLTVIASKQLFDYISNRYERLDLNAVSNPKDLVDTPAKQRVIWNSYWNTKQRLVFQ